MNPVLEQIQKTGIIPVVVLDDAKDAEPLALENTCSPRTSNFFTIMTNILLL